MHFDPKKLSFSHCDELLNHDIRDLAAQLPVPPPNPRYAATSWAFLILCWKHLLEGGAFDVRRFTAEATDNFDDQSLDVVRIVPDRTQRGAKITVLQTKNEGSFSDTDVRLLDTGLKYLFTEPRSAVDALTNQRLITAIRKARRVMHTGPVDVQVFYVVKSDSQRVPDFVIREIQRIQRTWQGQAQFSSFHISAIGAQEIVARRLEESYRIPDDRVKLPIHRSAGSHPYIQFSIPRTSKKAYAFTVAARDLALFVAERESWIFNENLRVYLQKNAGTINNKIFESCTERSSADVFWLLNNGVTIACDSCHYVTNGRPAMYIERPQIVNGCQTSMTLCNALTERQLKPGAHLLVRVLELQERGLIDKITEATNSQTAIKLRDLRANDHLQRTLKIAFRQFDLYFETKPKEYMALARGERRKIVSNEKCGQACLAIEFRRPSMALSRKSVIWTDGDPGYKKIFSVPAIRLRRSYLIWQYSQHRRSILLNSRGQRDASASRRQLSIAAVKYGHLHVARILSVLLGGSFDLDFSTPAVRRSHDQALQILKSALRERKRARGQAFGDWFNELKSSETERAIERRLSRFITQSTPGRSR